MARTPCGTAYHLRGPQNAPPVVLIHGLGLNKEITWAAIENRLATEFRVIAYDLLGHGQSDVPTPPVDLTALSQQLSRLLDHLQIKSAALIGFSLGGMINRRFALDNPDRTDALVILNSPHDRGKTGQAEVEERARASAQGGPEAVINANLARWLTPHFHQTNPEMVTRIKEVVLKNDAQNYAAHRWVLAHGVKELIAPTPPIMHPALIMTCANDTGSTPKMSHTIATEMPNATIKIIQQLQHLGLIERPQIFANAITKFLKTTSA